MTGDGDEQVFVLSKDVRLHVRDRVAEALCTLVPQTMMMIVRTEDGSSRLARDAQDGLDRATGLMNLLQAMGASSGEGDSPFPTVVAPELLPALSELAVSLTQAVPDGWEREFWEEVAVAAMAVQADDDSAFASLQLRSRDGRATRPPEDRPA